MITGAHSIIYSSDAKADMDFFRNILKFPNVDVAMAGSYSGYLRLK